MIDGSEKRLSIHPYCWLPRGYSQPCLVCAEFGKAAKFWTLKRKMARTGNLEKKTL
jgi:hypothetical protein